MRTVGRIGKREYLKKAAAFLITVSMSVSLIPQITAFAENTVNVEIAVQYDQTEARKMLEMVNDFRTGKEAWFWNEDDETKTTFPEGSMEKLVYDYDLEQVAMQRAAEIALVWDHVRPNNEKWYTCTYHSTQPYGENIAAGYTTAESAYIGWREDQQPYEGQGHRRNMLEPEFTAVGIGHVIYEGRHYWVQEFGYSNSNAEKTAALDSNANISIEVAQSNIANQSAALEGKTEYELVSGESIEIPVLSSSVTVSGGWPNDKTIKTTITPEWKSDNNAVAEISNGKILAKQEGTAKLTSLFLGQEFTVTVHVQKPSCSHSNIVTEEGVEPSCTKDGKTQKKYCPECGEVFQDSEVIPALGHSVAQWNVTKEPTYESEGVRTGVCTRCSETLTESIPKRYQKDDLVQKLKETQEGEEVQATLSKEDEVLSQEVLETMQDKDINLKVTLDNGIAWSMNGKQLPETGLSDINLSVEKTAGNAGKLTESEISSLAGTRTAEQLVFNENGELGFAPQLIIDAKSQIQGEKAVLLQKTDASAAASKAGTEKKLQLADSALIKNQSVTFTVSRKADSAIIYGTNGDTDGDGTVKLTDMMQILHGVSGRKGLNEAQKGFADVDMNDKVDIQDLMRELHFVSGRSQSVYEEK